MWWRKPRTVTFWTDLSPDNCLRQLREQTDQAELTIFSFSGYKGSKAVLLTSDGHEFKLWKRRYYHNSFAPIFFGILEAQSRGTLIRGHFDMHRLVKLFMMIWLGFATLIGTPLFVQTLAGDMHGDNWVGLIVPPALVLWGILLPEFGRWMGRSEERYLLDFLETTLVARLYLDALPVEAQELDNRPFG